MTAHSWISLTIRLLSLLSLASKASIVMVSHLFAHKKTSCHRQPMGEVVDAVGQQVQVPAGLLKQKKKNPTSGKDLPHDWSIHFIVFWSLPWFYPIFLADSAAWTISMTQRGVRSAATLRSFRSKPPSKKEPAEKNRNEHATPHFPYSFIRSITLMCTFKLLAAAKPELSIATPLVIDGTTPTSAQTIRHTVWSIWTKTKANTF